MAKTRSERNICLFCFGDLGPDRVCRSCGKRADDSAPPHRLKPRSVLLKRFLIGHAIGEGGFGITYLAWDLATGEKLAIKEFFPGGYVSRDGRTGRVIVNSKQHQAAVNRGMKRFIDEASNLSKFKHSPGIVRVYDFFSAGGTAYIIMEYLDGISLKRYIGRKGRLDFRTTLTILKPVVYSLAEVHAGGLIHRDISPDNILITKDDEVKLIDFGASKDIAPGAQSVSIVLKQGYAPEEQYRLHGEQGPWTDMYALGVTIYYCVTGKLPPESIQRMYDDTIIPPSKLGARITPREERILLKALAVFAKDRYQTLDAFAADVYSDETCAEDERERIPARERTSESRYQSRYENRRERTETQVSEAQKCDMGTENFEKSRENEVPTFAETPARVVSIERSITPDTLREIIFGKSQENEEASEDEFGKGAGEYNEESNNEEVSEEEFASGYNEKVNEDEVAGGYNEDVSEEEFAGVQKGAGEFGVGAGKYNEDVSEEEFAGVHEDIGRRTNASPRLYPDYAAVLREKLKL